MTATPPDRQAIREQLLKFKRKLENTLVGNFALSLNMDYVDTLQAAADLLAVPEGTPPRVLELARIAAGRNHVRWKEGTKKFRESGHKGTALIDCPHSDCVLVRAVPEAVPVSAAAPEHQFSARMQGTLTDYHIAPGGEGPLGAEWKNKPHRLLYDLLGEVQFLRARLAERDALPIPGAEGAKQP